MNSVWQCSLHCEVFCGKGSVAELSKYIAKKGLTRGLFIVDPVLEKIGAARTCLDCLTSAGLKLISFSEIKPNPWLSGINTAIGLYTENHCEFIVVFGGGSSMDTAKGVATLATNPGPYTRYEGDEKIPERPAPLYAIPSTAGTGSEVTGSSVIYDDIVSHNKHSMRSPLQIPLGVALAPEFLTSLPPKVIADTGLDALAHALEAYVSTLSTPISDMFALEGIRLVAENLKTFMAKPTDLDAATNMLLASHYAGIAFAHAKLGIAHGTGNAMEHRFHMSHGAGSGMMTPPTVRFTQHACVKKYAMVARCFLKAEGLSDAGKTDGELAAGLGDRLEMFIDALGVPTRQEGITEAIAADIAHDSIGSVHCQVASPVRPTEEDIKNIVLTLRP